MMTQQLQHGDPVSIRTAAKLIGVHFTTLYRWIQANQVAFIRFGDTLFIPYTEVERIKQQRSKERSQVGD